MRYRIIIALLLVFATLAVYWPLFNHGFVNWDDGLLVEHNPLIKSFNLENLKGLILKLLCKLWLILL